MSGDIPHPSGCQCHICRREDAKLDRNLDEMRGNRPARRPSKDVGWPEPPVRSSRTTETVTGQLAEDCALVKMDSTEGK